MELIDKALMMTRKYSAFTCHLNSAVLRKETGALENCMSQISTWLGENKLKFRQNWESSFWNSQTAFWISFDSAIHGSH